MEDKKRKKAYQKKTAKARPRFGTAAKRRHQETADLDEYSETKERSTVVMEAVG